MASSASCFATEVMSRMLIRALTSTSFPRIRAFTPTSNEPPLATLRLTSNIISLILKRSFRANWATAFAAAAPTLYVCLTASRARLATSRECLAALTTPLAPSRTPFATSSVHLLLSTISSAAFSASSPVSRRAMHPALAASQTRSGALKQHEENDGPPIIQDPHALA